LEHQVRPAEAQAAVGLHRARGDHGGDDLEPMKPTQSADPIFPRIFTVRKTAVMLDSDLAQLYDVETKQFNRAISRNEARFPADFVFQLSKDEWEALRCQIGTLKTSGRGQHRKYRPWVFTEHGAIMAARILNSECRPTVELSEPATEWEASGSQFVILKMVGGTTFRQAGQGV